TSGSKTRPSPRGWPKSWPAPMWTTPIGPSQMVRRKGRGRENSSSSHPARAVRAARTRSRNPPDLAVILFQRQREAERRAAARFAPLGPDPAAVVLDDLFADRQPEAGAMRLAMGRERPEEGLGDLRRDAAPGILHLDTQLARVDRE